MEEAPANGKESSHSAQANGINEYDMIYTFQYSCRGHQQDACS